MSRFLSEAFKKLELLEEEDFNLSAKDGIEDMSLFIDDDNADESITIIDTDAETEDDLEDSYEGQAILDCPVCHSKIFKKIDLVKIDDEEELANVGEECPYCYSAGGFKVIGQVAPFVSQDSINVSIEDKDEDGEIEDDEVDVDIEESKDSKSSNKKSKKEPKKESFKEEFEKVELETEDQKIKIETEPKETRETEEQIIPITDTTEEEIYANAEEDMPEDDFEEAEVDVDEFDEESFDELGESYLKEVYKNIKSFKTTSIKENNNSLKIEGNITFKSGSVKPTSFLFEQSKALKNNKIKLIGENLNITKGKKAFSITGSVNGNKLVCESLNYNYRAKDEQGKSTRLYGTVKRK